MAKRTDKLGTTWPLWPHTKAKHELLRHYLNAWLPMLSRYHGRVVVLDAFAGPGVYEDGEPGSPPILLDTLLEHAFFPRMSDTEFLLVFNEQDDERHASLEAVMEELRTARGGLPKNVRLITENEGFQQLAEDILEALGGDKLAPTFAFLDPFGYRGVPMELIGRLLAFDRCELFIYFDFNSVNRFSTAGNVDERLEELFGTDEFKNAPPDKEQGRGQFLHDLYERQLRDAAGFKYVQSFEMVNASGHTGYYLFFCTRSLDGLDKMKQAMWKVAPAGDYRFDDRFAGQTGMFDDEVDTGPLQEQLVAEFSGETVPIDTLRVFTIEHTPYASTHLKRKTLDKLEKATPPRVEVHRPGKTGYPDGTRVTFL